MDAVEPILLNCLGLLCPLPVIRVQERVEHLAPATRVDVLCSDPGALEDIPAWCRLNGHRVLATRTQEESYLIRIQIGEQSQADGG